ncbi:hypothetical protein FRC06_000724, partial [Ceratobasidium sp. 370]
MSNVAAGLRDIFVVRCVGIFIGHFKCTDQEGMHEATQMASLDGMFDCEFLQITLARRIKMDLTCMFPKDMQACVRDWALFSSPLLGMGEADRKSTARLFQALRSIEHQIVLRDCTAQVPHVVHGVCVDPDSDPVLLSQTDRERSTLLLNVGRRATEWQSVEPAITPRDNNASPRSWGEFLPWKYLSNAFKHSGGTHEIEKAFALREPEYRTAWNAVLDDEFVDWVQHYDTVDLDLLCTADGTPCTVLVSDLLPVTQYASTADKTPVTAAGSQDPAMHYPSQHAQCNRLDTPPAMGDIDKVVDTGFVWSPTQRSTGTQGNGQAVSSSPSLRNLPQVPRILVLDSDADDRNADTTIPSNQEAAARQAHERKEKQKQTEKAKKAAGKLPLPNSPSALKLSPCVVDSGSDGESDTDPHKSGSSSDEEWQHQPVSTSLIVPR